MMASDGESERPDRGLLPGPTQLSEGWRLANIIMLGLAFMLLFTAFQTSSMVEQSVLEAAKNETKGSFTGSGYVSLSIIYGTFALSNWMAPSVVTILGPKWSMFLGGLLYCLFIAAFLKPLTSTIYLGSVLVGMGAAIIWTGQGNFLTINSDSSTIGRNSGIFWALLQMSLLAGNLYVYLAFEGEMGEIGAKSRFTLYAIFTALGLAGCLILAFLRMPPKSPIENINEGQRVRSLRAEAAKAFFNSLKVLFTRNMLLLSLTFAYTGFELTFWSGVYGTSVGHTEHFGNDAKRYIGLSGIFIGIGEILGGMAFGIFGKRTNSFGRSPIVLTGFVVHIFASYLIFLSLPSDSPLTETSQITYITPKLYIVLINAFLLGFGDSCFNTQSLASAIGFAYSSYLQLQWQLLIMVIFNALGTYGFFLVEWSVKSNLDGYTLVPQNDD